MYSIRPYLLSMVSFSSDSTRSSTPPPHPVVDLQHVKKTRLHITEDELQLKDNDEIIKKIDALHGRAVERRNALLGGIAYKRSIIAPIRRLPFELLGMVFTELVESASHSPLPCLALVCRHWRYVVKSTPACWSRLVFAPFLHKSFRIESYQNALASAGTHPLALKLDFSLGRTTLSVPRSGLYRGMDEAHGAVEDHAWRELEIIAHHLTISTREVLEPFIAHLLNTKYPTALTSLSFDVSRSQGPFKFFDFTDDNEEDLEEALNRCTSLTSLTMPARAVPISHSILSRLTHLHLKYVAGPASDDTGALLGILAVLSKSSILTSLKLSRLGDPSFHGGVPNSLPFQGLGLASVETLDLGGWGHLNRLFRIRFPSLRSLILRSTRDVLEAKFLFHAMIEEFTSAQLTKLTLHGEANYSEADLIWFLERLPTLVELQIPDSVKLSQKTLGALSKEPTARKPWTCPKLEVLVIGAECTRVKRSDVLWLVEKRVTEVPEKDVPEAKKTKKGKTVKTVKIHALPVKMRKVIFSDEDMILAALNEQDSTD